VNRTRTTSNRLGLAGLFSLAAITLVGGPVAAQERSENRVVRPEGYLELEGDAGAPSGKGSFSVVPGSKREAKSPTPEEGTEEGSNNAPDSEEQVPPPPPPAKTPRELCQPHADRFARRLAALRGNSVDGGAQALDPAVQRAMFGRTALHATANDPDQPVPELTWDDELKDLYRAYQKCMKARR
jgi:hypothetical protein